MTRFFIIMMMAAALTACGTRTVSVPVVRVETITPPVELLSCADEPPVPAGPLTLRDLARHLVDVAEAGAHCRGRLDAVKQWVEAVKPVGSP